jgi:ligand-binding sensor domain-containing protein
MRVYFKVSLLLAFALCCGLFGWTSGLRPVLAQGETSGLWQSFLSSDGIPSGNILSIYTAQDGTLWFGTDAGASQYDGSWRDAALPSKRVRAITQTADGALWFGTEAGLARRSPDGVCCRVWTAADGLPSSDIHALVVGTNAPDGSKAPGVWVGTTKGLAYIDGEHVNIDSPVAGADIQALTVTPEGDLVASVAGRGVWQRGQAGDWQTLGKGALVGEGPLALWAGQDGRIWAGTSNGLVYYQNRAWQRHPLLDDDKGLKVLAILQDRDGGLWAGTERGLFLDPDAAVGGLPVVQHKTQRDGLVNDHVRAIAADRDGGVWFGTIAGASRYAGGSWQASRDPLLAGQRVNTALVDHAGRTWVGMERNGLALWDGTRWQRPDGARSVPDNRIVSLSEDAAERIWVSSGGGVGYFEPSESQQFTVLPGVALVYAFEQAGESGVWLATGDGLYRWDAKNGLQPVSEFDGKRVNAIHQAADGTLWAGTQADGLLRLADGRWQPVTDSTSGTLLFNDIVVNGIDETSDGSLWVGTYNNGLWRLRAGQWEQLDAKLASPKVLSLTTTGKQLWVGTRQGLAGWDGQTWQNYSGDVLPDPAALALAPGNDGTLWIGTMDGLAQHRPEKTPPWAAIEALNLAPLTGGARLNDDVLHAVRVAGGDLATRSEDLLYVTQLDGVDAEPQVQKGPLLTGYNDVKLAPGFHTLRVQARDTAFNYSPPVEARIFAPRFVPLPKGLRTRADVLYPVLGLGILVLGLIAVSAAANLRSRARNRELTDQVAERQQEAVERRFNPYISGEPVRQPAMFFGRDELLRRIFNALHQNSIMIHGQRRMGKTTLLYQLAEMLRQADDPEWAFIPVYMDLEGTSQSRFFYVLMDAIWGALQAYALDNPPRLAFVESTPEDYTDREFTADLRLALDSVIDVVAPRKARVILLLDEMDVVSAYDTVVQQQLRRIFMSPLAVNLGAVVAGIQISKTWDRLESPWYNMFNEIPLELFTDEQARELLVEPVRGVYEWDPAAIEFVVQQSEGYPHRLQQYALEAVNQMLAANRQQITLDDVQAAHEIIERAKTM